MMSSVVKNDLFFYSYVTIKTIRMRIIEAKTCHEALQIIMDTPIEPNAMSQLMSDIITLEGTDVQSEMWQHTDAVNDDHVRTWEVYKMKRAWLNKVFPHPEQTVMLLRSSVQEHTTLPMIDAMKNKVIEWLIKYN